MSAAAGWRAASLVVAGGAALLVTLRWGFRFEPGWVDGLEAAAPWVVAAYAAAVGVEVVAARERHEWWRVHRSRATVAAACLVVLVLESVFLRGGSAAFAVVQGLLALVGLAGLGEAVRKVTELRIRPPALAVGSFAALVVVGTLLLKLPRATEAGITWGDALFTATSAVCVTGLTVVDTAEAFTAAGQVILVLLMQAGGLGITLMAASVGVLFGGALGVRERVILRDQVAAAGPQKLRDAVRQVVLVTVGLEAVGAAVLFGLWSGVEPDPVLRLGRAVFHGVSAFCNAGFSNAPGGVLAGSGYAANWGGLLVITALVVAGGLGPAVLVDAVRPGWRRRRLQTRLVLAWSAGLLATGMAGIWIVDAGRGLGGGAGSVVHALFQSAMTRTAGFNSVDLGGLAAPSVLLMVGLMWIGGAPGSTAGGVRVTTVAAVLALLRSIVRGREEVRMQRWELPRETCDRAAATVLLSLAAILTGAGVLVAVDGIEPLPAVFEVVSALSTVGLSLGATTEVGPVGRGVLVVCMFGGRLGLLTLLWAVLQRAGREPVRRPREELALL